VIDFQRKSGAREAILKSIRHHLAASRPHDAVRAKEKDEQHRVDFLESDGPPEAGGLKENGCNGNSSLSALDIFKENLEAVGGHCVLAIGEWDVVQNLTRIITSLQATPLRARRIALSNAPIVERLIRRIEVETDEITVSPSVSELFGYDVGVTSAQGAIAETGTLVLESECERHRLVSLLPPVHIAVVEAGSICLILGEALSALRRGDPEQLSRTVTFITGPSRTADIELTLAIGVHGPQELYVIVNNAPERSG
jgi:L-lactate dehydrogenase complex protein LldG